MSTENDRIQIREDRAQEFRWARVAGNNEIIAVGEGYTTRYDAIEGAKRANPDVPTEHINIGI